jgi:flavin-dependent dehydrogenase
MGEPEYDAVIAGGGLAGLSLAAHLAAGGWRDRRVLVVDDRAARPSAVAWGFWSARPGLLDDAVSHTYDRVRVRAAGTDLTLPLGRYRYRIVRRADLVRIVRWMLYRCPGFEIRAGHVDGVQDGADAAETTVDGRVLTSRWVPMGLRQREPAADRLAGRRPVGVHRLGGRLRPAALRPACADPVRLPGGARR